VSIFDSGEAEWR